MGTVEVSDSSRERCPECGGEGKAPVPVQPGEPPLMLNCQACGATGRAGPNTCSRCHEHMAPGEAREENDAHGVSHKACFDRYHAPRFQIVAMPTLDGTTRAEFFFNGMRVTEAVRDAFWRVGPDGKVQAQVVFDDASIHAEVPREVVDLIQERRDEERAKALRRAGAQIKALDKLGFRFVSDLHNPGEMTVRCIYCERVGGEHAHDCKRAERWRPR